MSSDSVVVDAFATTDVGHKRELNEDSYLAEMPVFLVADGMGGHDSGEQASSAVISAFRDVVAAAAGGPTDVESVAAAIGIANEAVGELSRARPHGAGSTLTGIALISDRGVPTWLIFNLGDSRVYRMYKGELTQITKDHSLVQELVDAGELTIEQALHSKHRNVITRAVGADMCEPDFWLATAVNDERFLICSDGLYGEVEPEAIKATLAVGGDAKTTAELLQQRALDAGGRDNVTVLVIDVASGGVDQHSYIPTGALQSPADDTEIPDDETAPRGRR